MIAIADLDPNLLEGAVTVATRTATDPAYDKLRQRVGDLFTGALAAGVEKAAAIRIANVHAGSDSPHNPVGDLAIGAYYALEEMLGESLG